MPKINNIVRHYNLYYTVNGQNYRNYFDEKMGLLSQGDSSSPNIASKALGVVTIYEN